MTEMDRSIAPAMEEAGLVYAFAIDGDRARPFHPSHPDTAPRAYSWVHVNLSTEPGRQWVLRHAGLPPQLAAVVLDRTQEPGVQAFGNGCLIVLEDRLKDFDQSTQEMSDLRVWIERDRVVTGRWKPLAATDRLRFRLQVGTAPASAVAMAGALLEEIAADIEAIAGRTRRRLDLLEDDVLDDVAGGIAAELGAIRREAIKLRRRVVPLRQMLGQLETSVPWAMKDDVQRFETLLGRIEHVGGEVMEALEQARLLQDEFAARNAERSGRNLYIISILTAVLMPLNIVTGIFGMNVAGLPGLHSDGAFLWVMLGMAALAAAVVGIFKLKRWF
ncbi:MAG: CorA family divalent cation transporter [Pseudomonadota bacterium]